MSTSAEFNLIPGPWIEVAPNSANTVIQNLSKVDVIVRTGDSLPSDSLYSGILIKPSDSFTLTSDVTTENCYARILNKNSSNATIFVWS